MTSETDAEFVERMRFCFADDVSYKDIDRYEALARRGAEAAARIEQLEAEALNKQYDVYAAAREEYRKKIDEQAARIEQLEAALREIADMIPHAMPDYAHQVWKTARAALGKCT